MSRKRGLLNSFMPRVAYTSAKGVQWYEVTWYSQLLTIIFCFGVLPTLGFYIGTQYQQTTDAISRSAEQLSIISD
jgi:hypothetical protein